MPTSTKEHAETLVREILKDLSDRAGVPEWLGSEHDDGAMLVRDELVRDVVEPFLSKLVNPSDY
jgi:hypothetical protein